MSVKRLTSVRGELFSQLRGVLCLDVPDEEKRREIVDGIVDQIIYINSILVERRRKFWWLIDKR